MEAVLNAIFKKMNSLWLGSIIAKNEPKKLFKTWTWI